MSKTIVVTPAQREAALSQIELDRLEGREPDPRVVAIAEAQRMPVSDPALSGQGQALGKTSGAIEGAKDKFEEMFGDDEGEDEVRARRPARRRRRSAVRDDPIRD